jgi:hypothetical protein
MIVALALSQAALDLRIVNLPGETELERHRRLRGFVPRVIEPAGAQIFTFPAAPARQTQ